MGGRGAGKTRAGAEWVRSLVEGPGPNDPGKARRIGLIGETCDQAREDLRYLALFTPRLFLGLFWKKYVCG